MVSFRASSLLLPKRLLELWLAAVLDPFSIGLLASRFLVWLRGRPHTFRTHSRAFCRKRTSVVQLVCDRDSTFRWQGTAVFVMLSGLLNINQEPFRLELAFDF
jgi:hypothetical protein